MVGGNSLRRRSLRYRAGAESTCRKADIIKKLRAIKGRCGAAGMIVAQVAEAIESGVASDGKSTIRKDKILALALAAQMIESSGQQQAAVELMFIVKSIQDLGDD